MILAFSSCSSLRFPAVSRHIHHKKFHLSVGSSSSTASASAMTASSSIPSLGSVYVVNSLSPVVPPVLQFDFDDDLPFKVRFMHYFFDKFPSLMHLFVAHTCWCRQDQLSDFNLIKFFKMASELDGTNYAFVYNGFGAHRNIAIVNKRRSTTIGIAALLCTDMLNKNPRLCGWQFSWLFSIYSCAFRLVTLTCSSFAPLRFFPAGSTLSLSL